MAGTVPCRTCGQANATDSEYCVRCGERMPDPSSTQMVESGGATEPQAYPWEPPAEWDPGELPQGGAPAPTWVGQSGQQGAGPSGPGGQPSQAGGTQPVWGAGGGGGGWSQPSTGGGFTPPPQQPKSKKPLLLAGGAVVVIAAIVAVVLVLVAGGSDKKSVALNGLEKKSVSDVLSDARIALRDAKSVHLTGNVTSDGRDIKLDLVLAGSDAKGTLTLGGNDVQLIKVNDAVYVKGDADFLRSVAGKNGQDVLDQLNGRWLKTTDSSDFDSFSLDGFANLLKDNNASSSTLTQSELNGAKVVVITQKDGSALTIANTGPAYPLQLAAKGDSGGNVTFTDYNAVSSITAPTDVLDIDALTPSPTPTPSDSPSLTPSPTDSTAVLAGAYTCVDDGGSKNGGTLVLISTGHKYTLSGGAEGGFWGTSGNAIAFSGGALDQFGGRFTESGKIVLRITGKGSNASVSYTCTAQ